MNTYLIITDELPSRSFYLEAEDDFEVEAYILANIGLGNNRGLNASYFFLY